jgi:uncharacterized protein (TIRG00374 family)
LKKVFTSVLKFALAAGLIYWLIATEKITAEPFIKLWATPWLTVFVFVVVFAMIFINNYRWLLLLQGQQIVSSVSQTLSLTFIGSFFNLAMPGSVGGDVIKAYYIAQEQPGTKLRAATSVLMDRIVGLYAMGLIALAAVLLNLDKIMSAPHLKALALFVVGLVAGFTVFFMIGFSSRIRTHALTVKVLEKIPAGKLFERLYDAIHDFRHGKRQFALGIVLSIIVQSLNILALFVVARTLHFETASLGGFFFIIPLGLIATAIPISPAGIGVGQAVFLALFTWYDGSATQLGPTLITISQVVQAIWSLVGAVLYFLRKSPASDKVQVSVVK